MLKIDIPGTGELRLRYLVMDYNGTIARDGTLIPEVAPLIRALAADLEAHVVTADTFGQAAANVRTLPVRLEILPADRQDLAKAEYVRRLGAEAAVCLGNGRNDAGMLREAALGICVVEAEGASVPAMQAADIVCRSAREALELLRTPQRLIATLRV